MICEGALVCDECRDAMSGRAPARLKEIRLAITIGETVEVKESE